MPSVIIFNNGATPAQVKQFLTSVDPTPYQGRPDVKIYDDTTNPTEASVKSFITGKVLKYLKVSGNSVVDYTQAEKDALDSAEASAALTAARNGAKDQIVGTIPLPILLRALADILKDEINILRGWTVSFKAEVAASTSLADLKTRVATLSTLSDRTLAQLKTAIQNRIDSGGVDS